MAPPAAGAPSRGPVGKVRGLLKIWLLTIVTLGIYSLYVIYKSYDEMHNYSGITASGSTGLLLAFFAAPVNLFFLPSQINTLYASEGEVPPVSVKTGFWIYLPLLGPFIWFIRVYGALNRFWKARGAV